MHIHNLKKMVRLWTVFAVYPHIAFANELPVLDCVIEPYEVIEVSSAAEGVIESIHVERNDLVKRDQVLAQLESDVEKASLAFARLNASLNTDIELRRASSEFDQRNRGRIEALYTKKAIPLHHKDEAQTDAAKSRWLLTKAQDDKRLAALELARADAVVRRKTVRSPIDGVVVARHKSPGEYIEDQAIVTVAQLHPLRVEVIAPFELFGQIQNGMTAKVFPELASTGTHAAKVVSVDRVMDGASGTFDVRLELPNPDYKIPSGLKCQIEFAQLAMAPELETAQAATLPSKAPAASSLGGSSDSADITSQAMTCNAIGPFINNADAEKVTQALNPIAHRIVPARQVETVIDSYAVLAPRNAKTLDDARIQERILKYGISDTKLIKNGELAGQMSFGVFNHKRAAEQRRTYLASLGFKVLLKPKLSQQPRIWLEVEAADSKLTDVGVLQSIAHIDLKSELKLAPCGYPEAQPGAALALEAR